MCWSPDPHMTVGSIRVGARPCTNKNHQRVARQKGAVHLALFELRRQQRDTAGTTSDELREAVRSYVGMFPVNA